MIEFRMNAVQYSKPYSQCHCAMGGRGWVGGNWFVMYCVCVCVCVCVCMTYCQRAQQSCLHQTTLGHLTLTGLFAIL